MFSLQFLEVLRAAEMASIAKYIHDRARVLEIGAGTGQQAKILADHGFDVIALEVPSSLYASTRVFPITDYDGECLPVPDSSVDVVFSSNVLEHVRDLDALHREIRRVLRPDGYCVHVVPTPSWRLWTTLSAFPDALQRIANIAPRLLPRGPSSHRRKALRVAIECADLGVALIRPFVPVRHGERGNAVSELWLFRPAWWRKTFEALDLEILHDAPMELFYTGNMVLGERISLDARRWIAQNMGSACHLFKVRPR